MIDNVVAALGLGLNLTDEEIADVLWLAVQMQQFGDGVISEQGDRNEALDNSVSNRESPKQPTQPLRNADRDRQDENKKDEQNFEVHSKNDQGGDRLTRRSDELQLKIPDARSLQKPLELARSLRPLMRRVPSQVNTLLDEEATVRRIAEEKIWCPVLRPALEPWLDLALVIDDSASMLMWRHTIAELQHFLSSYGVFRDVRVWRLGTDKAEKVCIYAGATASNRNGSPRSPSELIEANGRGLVLVVSDCIAPIWRNGAIASALQIWSRSGMVAILQMLPDWLWARTALGRGVAAQFSALAAGIPNYQLTTTTVSTWYDIDLATSIKIPVVTLEPEKFTAWAEMLAGKGGAWSAGIVFEPELFSVPEVAIELDGASELDAEDRVQSFRLTASPIARRLAGLLAAAPVISLPIVRILQSKVLTQSQPVHVAEVFLGGLLKPLSEITAKTNPNYVQYDFIEGVRDLLLESVPSSEIVNVVAVVSEYIAERLGISLEEFGAVIRNPRQVQNTKLVSQTRPFAILTAQILKRLGGEYVVFAEEVEQANINLIQRSTAVKTSNLNFKYLVGGALPANAPSYIERKCDRDLYDLLKNGKYCYVFNSRQMGKTSLMRRVAYKLQQNGTICAMFNPLSLRKEVTKRQWYVSAIYSLAKNGLNLEESFDLQSWIIERESISPEDIFSEFIETVVLQKIHVPIVIFIEEIDWLLSLSFSMDSFFDLVISFFEYRKIKPDFNRITFSLLGVVSPIDLIESVNTSNFNKTFTEVELEGFTLNEAMPLVQGFANKVDNPQRYLEAVIRWTGGMPFLTQRLLWLITQELETMDFPPKAVDKWIDKLVQDKIIDDWKNQDKIPHLTLIEGRLLHIVEENLRGRVLSCYQQILINGEIDDNHSQEILQLRLSGLVVSQNGKLRAYNPIYAAVFDNKWVEQQLGLNRIDQKKVSVRNCAVIIGINDYDEILPLRYAKNDAENMRDFFVQDLGVGHDHIYFFTDDSPRNTYGRKTQPTYGTLLSFLADRFETPFLAVGDTLWFYFAGHGMNFEGRDYLLPSDGNPRTIKTAIPISYVTERLRRSGADNIVMLIDGCFSDGSQQFNTGIGEEMQQGVIIDESKKPNTGVGIGEEEQTQQGVITFFSCRPSQVSYEIDELRQGAFTKVLLEALRIQGEGNCATVERFAQYLRHQVPRLTRRYKNYEQIPYAVIEPARMLHYILLPKFANLTDIQLLKADALEAEVEGDFMLAWQLWMRINVAASGTDMQAINAFQRLAQKRS
ncbi:SAV_2336 N-terminal domain-related protein [Pseudanabaena sp. ABRG5-3]|uniref:SAV_2336 N-terminal domain-related protein n=1 Tax=Pseudanabaena sp. ABRG5-3 TaxID=685565 RepID=UPI000DC704C2|nr:SAV_2336 N-terminal domain-related protein [Pseudanabaena sp. ABRG5-3]BBC26649.1 metallophosphoesterase [Pseudanabaena sp. ABRG5-3]